MTDPIRTPAEALAWNAAINAAKAAAAEYRPDRPLYARVTGTNIIAAIDALAVPIPPAPDDEALVKIVAQALWEHAAMSFAPWCEAKALELERQGYVAEARAVLTALREVGALRHE